MQQCTLSTCLVKTAYSVNSLAKIQAYVSRQAFLIASLTIAFHSLIEKDKVPSSKNLQSTLKISVKEANSRGKALGRKRVMVIIIYCC